MLLNNKKPDNEAFFGILAIGDVVGRVGRECLAVGLKKLRERYSINLVIANVENAAGGFGLTEKICKGLVDEQKIDVLTTGNHWADKQEIFKFSPQYRNLIFPANMYNVSDPMKGFYVGKADGHYYAVINLTGVIFMKGNNTSAFAMIDKILELLPPYVKVIVIDFHAEATSEKQAFAHYIAERVSLVFGTHTHCQTSDERILSQKTGYITDLGMTGPYDSVIGMDKKNAIQKFLHHKSGKLKPAKNEGKLCGIYATVDPMSGYCSTIERIQENI